MPTTIEREIVIAAAPEVVWETLTDARLAEKWFADRVDIAPVVGYEGSMTFEHDGRDPHNVRLTVVTVEPPHRFAFRWTYPEGEAAAPGNSTLVIFTLSLEGDGTHLRVEETGMEFMGWDDGKVREFADDHGNGWRHFLGRLNDQLAA